MKNTILIVENNLKISDALRNEIAKKTSFVCIFTRTIKETLEILKKEDSKKIFAAVADLHLPDSHEGEIIDLLLSHEIPTIVFTDSIDEETVQLYNNRPIVEYLTKTTIQDIHHVVQVIINLRDNSNESVLIVDDSRLARATFRNLLQLHRFQTFEAADGEEALQIMQSHPQINIILTDYHMPKIDGLVLSSRIRREYSHFEKAILAITADDHPLVIARFLKSGANDFIVKPPRKEEFYARLYRLKETINFYQNLKETQLLLQEQKDALDDRSIVSKTDENGVITYANDRFIEISGYSRNELIGQKYNVLRHPDMPAEVFEKMWQTINQGQVWNGIIKDQSKDGKMFIVDSTVKPIVDSHGKIREFISIRHDLTELLHLHEEIIDTQKEIIVRLGEVAETRSKETGNHIRRVAEYSVRLGSLYGLSEDELKILCLASPLHDIGKIAIPDAILLKPGKLDPDEFEIMKEHAQKGFDILKSSTREILQASAIIAHQHHERWDGTGYPQKLEKENIHIFGRITALADVFDALSTERIYKAAWPMEQILEYISNEKGRQFDPKLTELFLNHIEQFVDIKDQLKSHECFL